MCDETIYPFPNFTVATVEVGGGGGGGGGGG